jgi:hypothetical protein
LAIAGCEADHFRFWHLADMTTVFASAQRTYRERGLAIASMTAGAAFFAAGAAFVNVVGV